MLVFLLAAVNAAVVLYDRYLLAIEMKMRVRHVANRLKQVIFTLYEKLLNENKDSPRPARIRGSKVCFPEMAIWIYLAETTPF